jgi:hypothetical protein
MVNADHRRVKVEEKRERREIKGEKIETEKKGKKQKGIMVFHYFQPSREVVLLHGSQNKFSFIDKAASGAKVKKLLQR